MLVIPVKAWVLASVLVIVDLVGPPWAEWENPIPRSRFTWPEPSLRSAYLLSGLEPPLAGFGGDRRCAGTVATAIAANEVEAARP